MAELASGAVTSLLGIIRDEALLLKSVRGDVQFIKQEMESMNSFLACLARAGEHDEQVQAWMNQVRDLAQDCNNCISIYRYHGDPDIHRARDGLRRYVWWLPWFVRKVAKQHDVAVRLREVKDQARDIGERRLRYGVEVPAKEVGLSSAPATGSLSTVLPFDIDNEAASAEDAHRRRSILETRSLDEYLKRKLDNWINKEVKEGNNEKKTMSVSIVSPLNRDACNKLADDVLAIVSTHFKRNFLVNIPQTDSLGVLDILYSILHELQLLLPKQEGTSADQCKVEQEQEPDSPKSQSQQGKQKVISEIETTIEEMKVGDKIEKIKLHIQQINGEELDDMKCGSDLLEVDQSFHVLRHALHKANSDAASSKQDQARDSYIFDKTVKMLQQHMERDDAEQTPSDIFRLDKSQYVYILKEVFRIRTITDPQKTVDRARSAAKQPAKTANDTSTSLGDDQIREIIDKVKLEIRQELQQYRPDMEQPKAKVDDRGQIIQNEVIEETKMNLEIIESRLRRQLMIKGMVDKIKHHLKDDERTMIVMKDVYGRFMFRWEEVIIALKLVGCIAGVMMVTPARAPFGYGIPKVYCYPSREPIIYSHVGQYYDKVLQLTSKQQQEENYNPQIFHDILKEFMPSDGEFWMNIFVRALYCNPKISIGELRKLHSSMQASPKSSASVTMKMFMFTYNDLPKEYRSCLLYLAIFPLEHNIRRSTLIGRWVVEGLITKEDWSSSVCEANRCFDTLIDRYLICPGDIGRTGKVKSCKVSDQVRRFITKIAKSQHIVETRLSDHLARHFSIFNDLRLRSSDTIGNFFKQLQISETPQLSVLKVLDLEGCDRIFEENPRCLKIICNKLLLLKYLSLRGTDITKLPNEINKLHELEVLDIRETRLPASATKHVVLLKLKHFLAGRQGTVTSTNVRMLNSDACWIPDKIGKMENLDLLSYVKAQDHGQELDDIGSLWKLRKFGVAIQDKKSHLNSLFKVIRNLHECLESLSITLLATGKSSGELQNLERKPPHNLKSLSISGTLKTGQLLPLLARGSTKHANIKLEQLAKVTLTKTTVTKDDLEVLAELEKLHYLMLQGIGCTDGSLTFKNDGFQNLSYFLVKGCYKGSKLTKIIFEDRALPKLEKIVLSQTSIDSICGLDNPPKLRELEFNGDSVPNEVQEAVNTVRIKRPDFVFKPNPNNAVYYLPKRVGETEKDDGAANFPFCWKKKKQIVSSEKNGEEIERDDDGTAILPFF